MLLEPQGSETSYGMALEFQVKMFQDMKIKKVPVVVNDMAEFINVSSENSVLAKLVQYNSDWIM